MAPKTKKCATCKKTVTKKCPGLECSRCEMVVHATNECANISAKQLAALRSQNGLEWSCQECLRGLSSSFFVPEDDPDIEDTTEPTRSQAQPVSLDVKKLLQDLSSEMRKIMHEQLGDIKSSLEFIGDQVAALENTIKSQNSKIKALENKNVDLHNANKHLELRVAALEQREQQGDQSKLAHHLELAGFPNSLKEDADSIAKAVASLLTVDKNDIRTAKLIPGRKDKTSQILIELNSSSSRTRWTKAARDKTITVGDITTSTPPEAATDIVYVRRALTPQNKYLLYQAKKQLRPAFKYVWIDEATDRILAKKEDNGKTSAIRSTNDIDSLLAK